MKTNNNVFTNYLFLVVTIAILIPITCYSFQNEPDGFEGIKWKEDIKSMKKSFIQKEVQGGFFAADKDIRVYVKIKENKMLGPANLKDIYYYFWKDKFICVEIITMGLSNFASLRGLCFERYGNNIEGHEQPHKNFSTYTWKGNVAGISLFHYKDGSGFDQAILRMYSQKLMKHLAGDKEKKH